MGNVSAVDVKKHAQKQTKMKVAKGESFVQGSAPEKSFFREIDKSYSEYVQAISSLFFTKSVAGQQTLNPIFLRLYDIFDSNEREKAINNVKKGYINYLFLKTPVTLVIGNKEVNLTIGNQYNNLLIKKGNTAEVLRKIQKDVKNGKIKKSVILDKLFAMVATEERKTNNLKMHDRIKEAEYSDMITNSLEALKDNSLTQRLGNLLNLTSLVQSGLGMSKISYSQYLSNKNFISIIAKQIKNNILIDQKDFLSLFYANSWQNETLTPKVKNYKNKTYSAGFLFGEGAKEALEKQGYKDTYSYVALDLYNKEGKINNFGANPLKSFQIKKIEPIYNKVTNEIEFITKIFQQVVDEQGNPILFNQKTQNFMVDGKIKTGVNAKVIYKEVQRRGNGQYGMEYGNEAVNFPKVETIPNNVLISLRTAGFNMTLDQILQQSFEDIIESETDTERKTYSGKVTSLKPNQIFAFGSNPLGINGNPAKGTGGGALVAYNIADVKQGEIVDNKLSDSGKAWGITTVTAPGKKKSKTPQQITEGIAKLYEYAKQNPEKEILVSDYSKSNLNGYTGQQMADMFKNAGVIPSNIVFNKNFQKLISTTTTTTKPSTSVKIDFQEEPTTGYKNRTVKNASADATIALAYDFNSTGERLTKSSVLGQNKKYIPLTIPKKTETSDISKADIRTQVDIIVNALNSVNAKTLNIAGNGIYTMKDAGWSQEEVDLMTYRILQGVLESPDLKNKIVSIRSGGQTGFDEAGAKAGIMLGIPTSILAPKGWKFRNESGTDISNEQQFKDRFITTQPSTSVKPKSLGDIKLNIIEDWVQSGQATTTVRSSSYHNSFYKGDGIYTTDKGNLVNITYKGLVKLKDDKIVGNGFSYTKDKFAKAEGFGTWANFQKNAKYAGKTLIDGGSVHLYNITTKSKINQNKPDGLPPIGRTPENCE
jgi:hypothetical protein